MSMFYVKGNRTCTFPVEQVAEWTCTTGRIRAFDGVLWVIPITLSDLLPVHGWQSTSIW